VVNIFGRIDGHELALLTDGSQYDLTAQQMIWSMTKIVRRPRAPHPKKATRVVVAQSCVLRGGTGAGVYCIRWPFRWSVKPALPQVTAVAVAIAADRGHLRYDEPIADIWPEFAQVCSVGLTCLVRLHCTMYLSLVSSS
jgi:hypothetical protein